MAVHALPVRIEAHVDVARARLRKAPVFRSLAQRLDGGRTYVVIQPMGRPRLYAHSANAVLEGFTVGLSNAPNARGKERLRLAIGEARSRLVARCNTLIEKDLPDVGLVAVHVDGSTLHVHALGPCRAYLHRKRHTNRITSRDEEPGGLLVRTANESEIALEPNDLVIAGTLSAFSSSAVARVATVLENAADTAPSVIAQLLTEPAEQAGSGAAVVVFRVR